MKVFKRALALVMAIAMIVSTVAFSASAYTVNDNLQAKLNKLYSKYDFSVGWGVYDISGGSAKLVAGYNVDKSFQSNCTIKAMLLYCMCTDMDQGKYTLNTRIKVDNSQLHYKDFPMPNGKYTISYIIDRMIHVSNSASYEILLRYIGMERFNEFLASIGSGTRVSSYSYMGNTTVSIRANEWNTLYHYCHSKAKNAGFCWNTLRRALLSPIRDGLARPVAHKCGWYNHATYGTAADCAIVSTPNGGCYLMVMFSKNNNPGAYNLSLLRQLARILDDVWNDYYKSLPPEERRTVKFNR